MKKPTARIPQESGMANAIPVSIQPSAPEAPPVVTDSAPTPAPTKEMPAGISHPGGAISYDF